ncbi:uroporphyrinogen-III methylase [Shewanella sp. SNU WT4]|uniref:uroporphyrinogen-III C-methyltransferase n=1 Tax=Shewanella sp. SNU WT4 TaxID=2590015 RepID=UPI00112A19E7|nr:uroporphyrinogen-III C-methyltransferase [Shewanella sp. SNU WT4]QDF68365.1 uroporphyrinogen-III methylase [Shewanella sp. SNU WT4]
MKKPQVENSPMSTEAVDTNDASAQSDKLEPNHGATHESSHEPSHEVSSKTISEASKATTPRVRTQATPKTNKLVWLVLFLLLLISLGALAVSAWLYQQITQQKSEFMAELSEQQSQFQQELSAPQAKIAELSQQLQAISKTSIQVDNLQKNQQGLTQKVSALAQRSPTHWIAAEAQYLSSLAGRKLLLEQDPATAAQLLIAADQRIAAINDPALIPLRKAFAKDIAMVQSITPVDVASSALSIEQVIEMLNQLPLNREITKSNAEDTNQELSSSWSDWRANLAKSWHTITKDFVTISHRTNNITPLLSSDQRWYLTENIKNKLLQAQLALYRNDQVNFSASLKTASLWVSQYYDVNNEQVAHIINTLNKLSALVIKPVAIPQLESTQPLQQLTSYGQLPMAQDEAPLVNEAVQ